MIHLRKGILGPGRCGFGKGRQIILLMQVVPFEVFLNLFVREGRAVVVEVLLDLAPIAEPPQFERSGEHNFVHHVPAAVGEAVPERSPHQVLLRVFFQVSKAAHAVVVCTGQYKRVPCEIQLALGAVDAEVGLLDDLMIMGRVPRIPALLGTDRWALRLPCRGFAWPCSRTTRS